MKNSFKINKGKLAVAIIIICLIVFTTYILVDFVKYPEQYITTWKKALNDDLANGNEKAIEYYNDTYVSNGKYLFGNKYIVDNANESDFLDMRTVANVEINEGGIILTTNNGNGYYLEGNYLND